MPEPSFIEATAAVLKTALPSLVVNLVYLVVMLAVTRLVVRCIAHRTGTDLSKVVGKINGQAGPAALFWGATTVGICVVAAAFAG